MVGVVAAYRKGAPDPCVPAPHVLMAGQRTTLIAAAAAAASVTSAIRPSVDQVRVVDQGGVLGVGVVVVEVMVVVVVVTGGGVSGSAAPQRLDVTTHAAALQVPEVHRIIVVVIDVTFQLTDVQPIIVDAAVPVPLKTGTEGFVHY